MAQFQQTDGRFYRTDITNYSQKGQRSATLFKTMMGKNKYKGEEASIILFSLSQSVPMEVCLANKSLHSHHGYPKPTPRVMLSLLRLVMMAMQRQSTNQISILKHSYLVCPVILEQHSS